MQLILICLIFILFSPTWITDTKRPFESFVVWNVGQGQWTTLIQQEQCIHFDIGGESAPWELIHKFCHSKENQVQISHWDLEHYRFLKKFVARFPGTCVFQENPYSLICAPSSHFKTIWDGSIKKDGQSTSKVIFIPSYRILLPGDSPKKEEKLWISKIQRKVKILILGHHGSKVSSSKELLNRLSGATAISSARKRKFGHPHPETVKRLKANSLQLLRTEEWGHLVIH